MFIQLRQTTPPNPFSCSSCTSLIQDPRTSLDIQLPFIPGCYTHSGFSTPLHVSPRLSHQAHMDATDQETSTPATHPTLHPTPGSETHFAPIPSQPLPLFPRFPLHPSPATQTEQGGVEGEGHVGVTGIKTRPH